MRLFGIILRIVELILLFQYLCLLFVYYGLVKTKRL